MVTISLSETSIAYMAAAVIISSLTYLAKRNQKQGWRKQRISWQEVQNIAAERAFASAPIPQAQPLEHYGDLSRLQGALIANGTPTRPEVSKAEPVKKNVLA
jgi:hypothetical protein